MMTDQPVRPDYLDGSDRYQLLYPVDYMEGQTAKRLECLQLRRLTLADRITLDEPVVYSEKLARILADMTGEFRVAILRIDAADADRIDRIFGYYLANDRQGKDPTARPDFLDAANRYTLLHPVHLRTAAGDEQITVLQLRRLTLADRLILDEPGSYSDRIARVLAAMTGRPKADILKIDALDADRIDRIFGYFLQPGTAIGATS